MEVFMDDITHGNNFDEALEKFQKVLKRYEQTHQSMSIEKFHMMMSDGVVLGHLIFPTGIQVDPTKIKVI